MKKLFLLLAMAGIMVACGDDKKDEKKETPNAENIGTYFDKLNDAIEAEDEEEFIEIYKEIDKATEDLSEEDEKAFDDAVKKYAKENPEKFMKVNMAAKELADEGKLEL